MRELGPFDMSYVEYLRAFLNRNSASPEIIPGLDPAAPTPRTAACAGQSSPGGPAIPWSPRDFCPATHPSLRSASRAAGLSASRVRPRAAQGRSDWNRLVEILIEHSPQGADTRCLAYYTPLVLGAEDFDNLHVRAGRLADAEALYDHPEEDSCGPSNLWAHDRSWVLCTDYDLWATKVAGPAPLVEALLNDWEIEAVRLPWAP
ncbi:hypothetical protein [Streptomyces sp. RerS4]|uniref:hypothetical protein n=1 Tax=Streptomyces sp. RerS4 TaxID=2942449 RepID=UPI00201BFA5C|nr:hypothetical protein [Streptomyces sp. RerS4]UQX04659.1 hypothetical protein M4D82_32220 [Streptomyces sp. RerS4]